MIGGACAERMPATAHARTASRSNWRGPMLVLFRSSLGLRALPRLSLRRVQVRLFGCPFVCAEGAGALKAHALAVFECLDVIGGLGSFGLCLRGRRIRHPRYSERRSAVNPPLALGIRMTKCARLGFYSALG